MSSFLGHHMHSTTILKFSNLSFASKPKPFRLLTYATIPARDRVIDFGKYKGRMLGSLPSTYLKWVSDNLRARDFEEWANLADQVLQDPVYNDRMEWELAEKLLNGNVLNVNSKSESAVAELLNLSQRFGWDNEDKLGWSKVDFQLLGTTKGGRIPRVNGKKAEYGERWEGESRKNASKEVGVNERRVERRERLNMKRGVRVPSITNKSERSYDVGGDDGMKYDKNVVGSSDDDVKAEVYNPFPGRETLLQKVLNRRRIT